MGAGGIEPADGSVEPVPVLAPASVPEVESVVELAVALVPESEALLASETSDVSVAQPAKLRPSAANAAMIGIFVYLNVIGDPSPIGGCQRHRFF